MIKQCEVCGKDFSIHPAHSQIRKCCSWECRTGHKQQILPMRICICGWCKREFQTKDGSHKGKYCSHECDMTHRKTVLFETAPARFWARVDKSGDCWLWTGATDDKGYGRLSFRGKSMIAPRVAYELGYGVAPGNFQVLHRCDNPPCVNPDHLFLGTNADNIRDMCAKGRAWTQQPGRIPRGADNPRAYLSHEQVAEIKKLYASGAMNGVELSRIYGVGNSVIYRVVNGKYE